eukprot:s418_g8.t1
MSFLGFMSKQRSFRRTPCAHPDSLSRKGQWQMGFICTLGPNSASMNLQRAWPTVAALRLRNEWVNELGDHMGSQNELNRTKLLTRSRGQS